MNVDRFISSATLILIRFSWVLICEICCKILEWRAKLTLQMLLKCQDFVMNFFLFCIWIYFIGDFLLGLFSSISLFTSVCKFHFVKHTIITTLCLHVDCLSDSFHSKIDRLRKAFKCASKFWCNLNQLSRKGWEKKQMFRRRVGIIEQSHWTVSKYRRIVARVYHWSKICGLSEDCKGAYLAPFA